MALPLLSASSQTTSSLALAWNASAGSSIAGYRLYEGQTSRNYSVTNSMGNATNATISGLAAGGTYFFAVTAYMSNGMQSAFSTEVSYTVPTNPPPMASLTFAASSGTITSPFVVSNGVVFQRTETGVTNGGRATFSFTVPGTGDYLVSGLVNASTTARNSFYVNIDAEPTDPFMIWDIPVTSGWANRTVAWRGNSSSEVDQFTPKVFNLAQGPHQLILRGREANTQLSSITISPVTTLPLPWQAFDVGTPVMTGGTTVSNGLYTVSGAGNLSGSADNFRFLYQSLTGDGEVRAQLNSLQNTSTNARAGVIIRETLTSGSRYAFMGLSPDGTFRSQARSSTAGTTTALASGSGALTNTWVRLVRSGDTLTGYKSSDGANWTSVVTNSVVMATNIYVGLAVASGTTSALSTATFTNVTAVP
jgi:hypothetical protein